MTDDILKSIQQLSKERDIDPEVFFNAIKEALETVAQRYFIQQKLGSVVQVEIDKNQGQIQVYTTRRVVREVQDAQNEISWKEALNYDSKAREGEEIKIYLPGETLGRIAAQTCKQLIMQKVQVAEQHNIYSKYLPLTGTLISGDVRRFENKSVIIGLETGEAIIPPKELSPKDEFKRGEIVKFIIKRVFSDGKGPLILGSRYMNDFVVELVKKEVPEVGEGIVRIFSVAREPGVKTKIAVYSTEKTVDPVGAIVGMNGNRVLSITKELRGERIDVIAWSNNAERFITSALTPGEVVRVNIIDPVKKIAEVTVSDDSLSATIGKKGINIKLALKLTKWNIQLANRMEKTETGTQKKL